MTASYIVEKFYLAALGLAKGTQLIQDRVAEAFIDDLRGVMEDPALPVDVGTELQVYKDAWKAKGGPHAWATGLSDDEASGVARWIYDTSLKVRRELSD